MRSVFHAVETRARRWSALREFGSKSSVQFYFWGRALLSRPVVTHTHVGEGLCVFEFYVEPRRRPLSRVTETSIKPRLRKDNTPPFCVTFTVILLFFVEAHCLVLSNNMVYKRNNATTSPTEATKKSK